ncbi:MAG: serine aminopeptidase domain-containing protein [Oscillospiraceae bacterium]
MSKLQIFLGGFLWVLYIIMFFCVITYVLFFRLAYKAKKATVENTLAKAPWAPYRERVEREIEWFRAQEPQQLYILTRDEIRLSARYLPAEGECRGRVVLMHDYRVPAEVNFAGAVRAYHEQGFDVLLCDERAHGESLGKWICFGARERYDCKLWVECLNKLYGDDKPVFLHGVGMGGTAVLMTAGLKLPRNVTAVVAEGAYTSPYAVVKKLLRQVHLASSVNLRHFDFWCRAMAGFKLKGASTQAALRATKLPVLLLHGSADEMAPAAMAEANYEACGAEKRLCMIPGAGHGVCLWAAEECGMDVLTFVEAHEALPEETAEAAEPKAVGEGEAAETADAPEGAETEEEASGEAVPAEETEG